jgi:hypothetical protein
MKENKSKRKSVKASSKSRTQKQSTVEEAGHEATLAADLANVFSNPLTPDALKQAIRTVIDGLESEIPAGESSDTAEHIERVLNWHRELGYRNFGQFESVRLGDGYHATRLKNPSVCRQPSRHPKRGATAYATPSSKSCGVAGESTFNRRGAAHRGCPFSISGYGCRRCKACTSCEAYLAV